MLLRNIINSTEAAPSPGLSARHLAHAMRYSARGKGELLQQTETEFISSEVSLSMRLPIGRKRNSALS